ncbi:MAG: hypothetical protein ACK2TV_04125, partial [Anaerolineales bacterium]
MGVESANSGRNPPKGVRMRIKADKDANQINFSFVNFRSCFDLRNVKKRINPNQTTQIANAGILAGISMVYSGRRGVRKFIIEIK